MFCERYGNPEVTFGYLFEGVHDVVGDCGDAGAVHVAGGPRLLPAPRDAYEG